MISLARAIFASLFLAAHNARGFSPSYRHSHSPSSETSLHVSSEPPPDDDLAAGTSNDEVKDGVPQISSRRNPDAPTSGALIEIPIDGSLVVLLPAAVIAFVGIATSVLVAVNAVDPVLAPQTAEATTAGGLSAGTSVRITSVGQDDCRGLCGSGSQQEDLDNLREFMGKFKKKGVDVDTKTVSKDSSGGESGRGVVASD